MVIRVVGIRFGFVRPRSRTEFIPFLADNRVWVTLKIRRELAPAPPTLATAMEANRAQSVGGAKNAVTGVTPLQANDLRMSAE